jgi:hypothetical protein
MAMILLSLRQRRIGLHDEHLIFVSDVVAGADPLLVADYGTLTECECSYFGLLEDGFFSLMLAPPFSSMNSTR